MSLVDLFCHVDDFCQSFESKWEQYQLEHGLRHRKWWSRMALSEIITIIIHFRLSNYCNFKAYYTRHVSSI